MKVQFILILLTIITLGLNAQTKAVKVPALTFAQLQDSMKSNPKRILVNLYTDWCLYCRLQDKQIENSNSIPQLLNQYFYYVKMNAEAKATINFNGRNYFGRSVGQLERVHELAEALGSEQGRLAYPILVVLDQTYQVDFRSHGLIDNKTLQKVLLSLALK